MTICHLIELNICFSSYSSKRREFLVGIWTLDFAEVSNQLNNHNGPSWEDRETTQRSKTRKDWEKGQGVLSKRNTHQGSACVCWSLQYISLSLSWPYHRRLILIIGKHHDWRTLFALIFPIVLSLLSKVDQGFHIFVFHTSHAIIFWRDRFLTIKEPSMWPILQRCQYFTYQSIFVVVS